MSLKQQRQQAIGRLIGQHPVANQPQLLDLLGGEGITATQATVSRDLEELGVIKVRVPGGHSVYALPELETERIVPWEQLRRVLGEWVGEVAVSANLVVLRTPPGLRPRRRLGARPQRARRPPRHRRRRRHAAVRRRRDDHGQRARRPPAGALRARSRRWLRRTPPVAGATLWHGRFASGPADALLAYTVSLPFDRRLWPDDIAGSRAHVGGLQRAGLLTDDEVTAILGALDQVARGAGERHVHVRPERRGHPHRGRAAGHRARRAGRRQAAHGAQPQRPDRHRPAAVVQARADRGRPARRRPRGHPAGPGRGGRRRLPPRLHARAAGPAGAAGPPPAGPRLGVRPRRRPPRRHRRAPRRLAARGRGAGRDVAADRPCRHRRRARVRRRLRQLARRRQRPRLRGRGAVRPGDGRHPPRPRSARSGCCGRARSSASPASTTPTPPARR